MERTTERQERKTERKGKRLGRSEALKGLSRVVQMALLASAWQPPRQQNVGGAGGGWWRDGKRHARAFGFITNEQPSLHDTLLAVKRLQTLSEAIIR